MIARSDLYEKKGKSPHAFCTDIDREGDVRVLANIVPNEYWMGTMLHELGHAVYSSKNIPKTLPYVLRAEAHILTTEGVAMQFERFSKSRLWLEKMGVSVPSPNAFEDAATRTQRNHLLIFSRWCQVMLAVRKGDVRNAGPGPEHAVVGDLVETYQQVKRPKGRNAPDYASKIHICSAPVYYHNYMMGQLFASQVHPQDREGTVPGDRAKGGDLRWRQARRGVHEESGVRAGPDARLEGAHQARHRRRPVAASIRQGLPGDSLSAGIA